MSEAMVGSEEQPRQQFHPSPFRKKLIQEVLRKLRRAVDAPTHERGDVLQQLFADVALEVDSGAQARLYGTDGISGGAGSSRFGGKRESPLCFYEVLAEHFAQVPEDGKELLALFVKLWSQSLVAQIFTLLFYEWLFEVPREEVDGYLRYSTAFVEGASTIFWIDLESNARRFFSLYHYTMNAVIMKSQGESRVPSQARRQLVLTLSRFFFFYEPASSLEQFLVHFPKYPASMGSADIFVIELTDQLRKVKIEPVLLHYLQSSKVLKGVVLQVPTSTRLRTALYGFTSPGGPMYPTRDVRHAAWETLDCLFPVGRNFRHLISMLFRLLHPYYWPMSFWNFAVISAESCVEAFVMCGLWVWIGALNIIKGTSRAICFFPLSIWHFICGSRRGHPRRG